jgi:hypothetical protein
VRAKFINDYHPFTSVATWIPTLQLWDTTIVAGARGSPSVEFGLGPDYKIDTSLGNPFYFNLGSSHNAPFREDASRQLAGIHVVPRSYSRHSSTLLLIRYGDLMKLASQIGKRLWIEWETWRNWIVPIELKLDVREFGLLHSHLLVICKDLKASGTLLRVCDFMVHPWRQQARDKSPPDRLPPYTLREFLLSRRSTAERLSFRGG